MLVVSRKKHESIVIDGSIHVEVISHMKDLVWVKLLTPRSLHVTSGSKKALPGQSLSAANAKPLNGHDQLNLAIGAREVVRLGESIVVGVLDADASRALFFVQAPRGMAVVANSKQEFEPEVRSTGQSLLQFMEPGERLKRDQDAEPSDSGSHRDEPKKNGDAKKNGHDASGLNNGAVPKPLRKRVAGPNFLPFPSPTPPRKPAAPEEKSRPDAPLAGAPPGPIPDPESGSTTVANRDGHERKISESE